MNHLEKKLENQRERRKEGPRRRYKRRRKKKQKKIVYNWNLVIHPYNLLMVSVCGANGFHEQRDFYFSCSFSFRFVSVLFSSIFSWRVWLFFFPSFVFRLSFQPSFPSIYLFDSWFQFFAFRISFNSLFCFYFYFFFSLLNRFFFLRSESKHIKIHWMDRALASSFEFQNSMGFYANARAYIVLASWFFVDLFSFVFSCKHFFFPFVQHFHVSAVWIECIHHSPSILVIEQRLDLHWFTLFHRSFSVYLLTERNDVQFFNLRYSGASDTILD